MKNARMGRVVCLIIEMGACLLKYFWLFEHSKALHYDWSSFILCKNISKKKKPKKISNIYRTSESILSLCVSQSKHHLWLRTKVWFCVACFVFFFLLLFLVNWFKFRWGLISSILVLQTLRKREKIHFTVPLLWIYNKRIFFNSKLIHH